MTKKELEESIYNLIKALTEIANKAHDNSTGPAVPDTLWEIREMAYAAIREVS